MAQIRWLIPSWGRLSSKAARGECKALRLEVKDLRAEREAFRLSIAQLSKRAGFLESAHGTATRLIHEARAESELARTMLQNAETELSLAVSDRLLATRLNEDLLREIQCLAKFSPDRTSVLHDLTSGRTQGESILKTGDELL